jgi:hypothetical protein
MTEAAREHERVLVRARYRRRREQILHKLSDSRRFMTKADHTRKEAYVVNQYYKGFCYIRTRDV